MLSTILVSIKLYSWSDIPIVTVDDKPIGYVDSDNPTCMVVVTTLLNLGVVEARCDTANGRFVLLVMTFLYAKAFFYDFSTGL